MTISSKSDENTTPIKWQRQVDLLLAMQLKMGTAITYQKLADEAHIPPPHRIHKLTLYLETLIKFDVEHARFIRASLVISRIRGKPAPGFFSLLSELGLQIEDEDKWHRDYIKQAITLSW